MLRPFKAITKSFHMGKIMPDEGNKPSDPRLFFFLAALFPALHLELFFGTCGSSEQGTGKIIAHKLLDVSNS